MVRESAISLYLLVFKLFFSLFKLFPQKKKTTFVASFGDNIFFTINELEKQTDEQVVILKTPQCSFPYENAPNRVILNFKSTHIIHWIKSIYHLSTSRKVFVDNYYGFLAVTNFKSGVECIQLWHAVGALKKFGFQDQSIQNRSPKALKRFREVYKRFDYVVVGSEKMASVFQISFGLKSDHMLPTGIPRTDFLFQELEMNRVEQSLRLNFPFINRKKIILYAPTYRDQELNKPDLKINLEKMYNQLKFDYVILLRLHPAINGEYQNKYPGFVYNVSHYTHVNHLLVITDVLVTDYSSIPFEFSLLNRPMYFFAYDLDEYDKTRGFLENYESLVPGPVVRNTSDLITAIMEDDFDSNQIKTFAHNWNEYSVGNSSERLIQTIYKDESSLTS